MRSTRHYLRMNVSNVIVGEYMCQGRMPQSVRERYLKMKDAPDHPANLDVWEHPKVCVNLQTDVR